MLSYLRTGDRYNSANPRLLPALYTSLLHTAPHRKHVTSSDDPLRKSCCMHPMNSTRNKNRPLDREPSIRLLVAQLGAVTQEEVL